ncbi:sigma E protease regulator RseP [Citrobacter freundii]|jgi:regulator of sigma E protease|uniref:sigma E protease regulator RseP n=1 Tax=Citrobacter freundii complex TaxID=1344959 RepID=UPI0009ABD7A3|nr:MULTISPECIES: sigma E protease regulator RseP [Citrobacter freundii complex]MBA8418323.1 sigma E protease regulator RseP [Citrobacter freundii]RNL69094.1 sigma E protease regulator RseP [Citrobacter sp. MH181794]MBF0033987.1 sigma E protease regulator RseP [Citrobacter freundii]MDE9615233.1 sigma E protease regulator RseP [Citrobacter portucalensis]OPW99426.1 RIP metalloprotease RseP [Citrobacter sp. A316]
MLSILWNLAAFIIALGVLITVHEFGHFWVARRCGVRVERFSIGFGKALWRRTDKSGTEYVIALIPLGGYVKMLDERAEPVAPELRHYAFNNKTVGQRAAIIAAGPIANFLFAIFAYWLVFIIGVPGVRPVVGEITPNSIAAQAQIQPGTELKAVDGIETPDWDAVRLQLVSKIGDEHTILSVAQFGSNQRQDKTLDLRHWAFEPDKEDPVSSLGMRPRGPQIEPVLSEVQVNSAASKAGLQAGDRIVKVNGQSLTQWMTFVTLVRDNPDKPLALDIERQGSSLSLTLTPDSKQVNGKAEGFAGVVPKVIPLPDEYKTVRQYGPFSAILEASDKTWQLMKLTVSMLGKLITGDVKLNNLSGPISIAQGAGMSAEFGIIYYLMFLALISVNLGIINLFPLPVLDGGHLLFLAIEKLKGGPVSERVQDFSYRIGSILLVLLMGLALFNDFSRL